jgi:hypothetical protein
MMIERHNRNPIINLKTKRISSIINKHHIRQGTTFKHPQILHINPLKSLNTTVPIKSMMYEPIIRIQIVQYSLSIAVMGGSKDNDLKVLTKFLQNLKSEGPYINPCLNHFPLREFDL